MDLLSFLMGQESASGSGSMSLNIAYGDTAPEDTSKLWIKAEEPKKITYSTEEFKHTVRQKIMTERLPRNYSNMGCAAVGTKIYLFGGLTDSPLDSIYVFDTETGVISMLAAKLPIARYKCGCVAVGTNIYIFGGYNYQYREISSSNPALDSGYVFDTITKTIVDTFVLPERIYGMGCAAVGTKIYLFGGHQKVGIHIIDTEAAKPVVTTIYTKLPSYRYDMGCAAVGTKIYLFGGHDIDGDIHETLMFDTETETITTLDINLNSNYQGMGCVTIGSKVYLFGGGNGVVNDRYSSYVYIFDPETKTITQLPRLLIPLSYMGCANVGSTVYLFGGKTGNNEQYGTSHEICDSIYCFSYDRFLLKGNIKIEPSLSDNLCTMVNTDSTKIQIGIGEVYVGNSDHFPEPVEAYLYKDGDWTLI